MAGKEDLGGRVISIFFFAVLPQKARRGVDQRDRSARFNGSFGCSNPEGLGPTKGSVLPLDKTGFWETP